VDLPTPDAEFFKNNEDLYRTGASRARVLSTVD